MIKPDTACAEAQRVTIVRAVPILARRLITFVVTFTLNPRGGPYLP
jgi:hypothetical protein